MVNLPTRTSLSEDTTQRIEKPAMAPWSQAEIESSQSTQRPIPPHEQARVFTWADVRDVVDPHTGTNRLDLIRRKPSERVIYKTWCRKTIDTYGSITAYMCAERLHWAPLPDSSAATGPLFDYRNPTPYADLNDFKILRNDWPYGSFEPNITHLIVWSKPRIPVDAESGLVTPESRQIIEAFVQRTFAKRLEVEGPNAQERVLWFKNWVALQSVPGLEHIHVLVRDVPEGIIREWTGEQEIQM
ncbi:MAG: hypothetical protein Q9222_004880 [Ikaeria aurantiellina]